jgi:hypothetical protein
VKRKKKKEGRVLEELALGRGGIADDANVDVAAQLDALDRRLVHSTEEHQQNATLDFIVT